MCSVCLSVEFGVCVSVSHMAVVPVVAQVRVLMQAAAEHKKKRDYTCFCVPRISPASLQTVESFGLHGIVRVSAFELALVPYDDDVASLAFPTGVMVPSTCPTPTTPHTVSPRHKSVCLLVDLMCVVFFAVSYYHVRVMMVMWVEAGCSISCLLSGCRMGAW
jgi:hypothetical protein